LRRPARRSTVRTQATRAQRTHAARAAPVGTALGDGCARGRTQPRPDRTVRARYAGSADLGDLRAALQLAHAAREAGALLLLDALGHHLGVAGQFEDDRVAGRHRAVAAHHHGVPEDLLEQPGGLRLHRALAGDHSAQEPAGAVHADEPHDLEAAGAVRQLYRHLGPQLPAQRALDLVDDAALLGDAGRDLLADLGPDALTLGCREGLQLDGAVVEHHGGGDDRVARDLDAQLHSVDARH